MKSFPLLALTCGLAAALPALACDLCAVYSATHAQTPSGRSWSLGAATQFTHFSTLRLDGDRVDDPAGQHLDSTISQFVLRRGFTDGFSAQLNVPFINRSFHRPEGSVIESDRERGLGDVTALLRYEILRRDTEKTTVIWSVLGGVKLPTGNTDRLAGELAETHGAGAAGTIRPLHTGHDHDLLTPPSGIHGHDLTLGSGSTDLLLGTEVYLRRGRFVATGLLQYMQRTRGDYAYRFADDLAWEAAPGAYLLLGHVHTLSLQLVASGEHKTNDSLAGEAADDTGLTSVYLGPRFAYTHAMNLSASVGADFPVRLDNTALQLTPDYRLRASLTRTF